MRCPFCSSEDSRVVDSRDVEDAVRRRRECLNSTCAERFTTYERAQTVALVVVKKDRRREEFAREKLLGGLRKACEKRPLTASAVEALTNDIETTLYGANSGEVASTTIGELAMDGLRALDAIAYVRFASVYRQFADIDALREELDALSSGRQPGGAQLPLLTDPAYSPHSIQLQPAAPNSRTRTRRPVRPVQTPTPLPGRAPTPSAGTRKRRRAR